MVLTGATRAWKTNDHPRTSAITVKPCRPSGELQRSIRQLPCGEFQHLFRQFSMSLLPADRVGFRANTRFSSLFLSGVVLVIYIIALVLPAGQFEQEVYTGWGALCQTTGWLFGWL